MTMNKPLPNVIYIGLQKTGSTFLRKYFDTHPKLAYTRHGKFFQRPESDAHLHGSAAVRAEYARLFETPSDAECLIDMYEAIGMGYVLANGGDWSVDTFLKPSIHLRDDGVRSGPVEVAERVKAACPDAKVLMTIRNQPDWLDSNFRHYFEGLAINEQPLDSFFATLEGKITLDAGSFDRTVAIYDQVFGAGNVHVIPLEQLQRNEDKALDDLCEFLGVDFHPYPDEAKEFNTGRSMNALLSPSQTNHGIWPSMRGLFRGNTLGSGVKPDQYRKQIEFICLTYAASNSRVARRLGLDLGELGYPV